MTPDGNNSENCTGPQVGPHMQALPLPERKL